MINSSIWPLVVIRELAAKVFNYDAYVEVDEGSDGSLSDLRIGETTSRRIHLTFDDGPHLINTPRLLDNLEQLGVLATFFVTGKRLENPEARQLLERIAAAGHQIGNHSYSHLHLTELSEKEIRKEISKTEKLIGDTDRGIKVFRPPFGDHNSLVDQIVGELGYRLVLWNVDTFDWHPEHQHQWVKHTMARIITHRDSIVLAHDTMTTTVDQVGSLIENIRELFDSKLIPHSEAFRNDLCRAAQLEI